MSAAGAWNDMLLEEFRFDCFAWMCRFPGALPWRARLLFRSATFLSWQYSSKCAAKTPLPLLQSAAGSLCTKDLVGIASSASCRISGWPCLSHPYVRNGKWCRQRCGGAYGARCGLVLVDRNTVCVGAGDCHHLFRRCACRYPRTDPVSASSSQLRPGVL